MTTQQQIVTPLLTILNQEFSTRYQQGIRWSLHKRESGGPLPDSCLVDNFKACVQHDLFNEQHTSQLYASFGFFLGMIHGGIITQDGLRRDDVTTLVTIHNQNFARGYEIGREWLFNESEPHERLTSDRDLITRLRVFVEEEQAWEHDLLSEYEELVYWYLGCIIGELSGCLFPLHQSL